MAGYTAKPLTSATWDDFDRLVDAHNGVFGGCWCLDGVVEAYPAEGGDGAARPPGLLTDSEEGGGQPEPPAVAWLTQQVRCSG